MTPNSFFLPLQSSDRPGPILLASWGPRLPRTWRKNHFWHRRSVYDLREDAFERLAFSHGFYEGFCDKPASKQPYLCGV